MYTLKTIPEDFVVREISTVTFNDIGKYLYFLLRKKNWNTLDAIQKIALILGVSEKDIGFAGTKDRNAVTEQVCSVHGVKKEKLEAIKLQDVTITFRGYGSKPITLGDLKGNQFEIVIRNFDGVVERISGIPNYFDEQRFSQQNVIIGRNIVKKDFKSVVALIQNLIMEQRLREHPHDYIGALKILPMRLLKLYVNAYQSYLWNETVARYLSRHYTVVKKEKYSLGELVFVKEDDMSLRCPLIGFDEEIVDKVERVMRDIIRQIMNEENITFRDFIIPQFPELSTEGEMRAMFTHVHDLIIGEMEDDELHQGKKKVRVAFWLEKGSYATMVIKRITHP